MNYPVFDSDAEAFLIGHAETAEQALAIMREFGNMDVDAVHKGSTVEWRTDAAGRAYSTGVMLHGWLPGA